MNIITLLTVTSKTRELSNRLNNNSMDRFEKMYKEFTRSPGIEKEDDLNSNVLHLFKFYRKVYNILLYDWVSSLLKLFGNVVFNNDVKFLEEFELLKDENPMSSNISTIFKVLEYVEQFADMMDKDQEDLKELVSFS